MLIDSTPKWGAKVVYGDTDSVFMFVLIFHFGVTLQHPFIVQPYARENQGPGFSYRARHCGHYYSSQPSTDKAQV